MSRNWLKIALVTVGLSMLAPLSAFAAEGAPAPAERVAKKAKGEKGDKAKHFPMTAAKFAELVEKRITKSKERLGERLDEANVPADKRKAIMADFDAGATKVRAAAQAAGKDGTVTAEEAKGVRELAKDLRKDARKKHGMKGKGKGKKGAADA